MAERRGPGRPATVPYCLDCHKEGLRPPEAGEKVVPSSYCRRHLYARQGKSRKKRIGAVSTRHEVIVGDWVGVPELAREALQNRYREQVTATYKQYDDPRRAVAYAFEYACMEWALIHSRAITLQEEDIIIAGFDGSRLGKSAWEPQLGPVAVEYDGPPLLPDPFVRPQFRAKMMGGPTTEGEPTFVEYYWQVFRKEPPEEFLDVPEEQTWIADDGRECANEKAMNDWNAWLARQARMKEWGPPKNEDDDGSE